MSSPAPFRRSVLSRRGTGFFALLMLAGAGFTAYLAIELVRNPIRLLDIASRTARERTNSIVWEIDAEACDLMDVVEDLGEQLSSGKLDRENLDTSFTAALESNVNIYGIVAAYAPLGGEVPDLFCPYWRRYEDQIRRIQVEDLYDYTWPDNDNPENARTHWYHSPMQGGSAWAEPYYGTASETMVITYGKRVDLPDEDGRSAVVGAVFSFGRLREILSTFGVGRTGYALLAGISGIIVAHPKADRLGQSLANAAAEDAILRAIHQTPFEEKELRVDDARSGRRYHVCLAEIPTTQWILATVFDVSEIVSAADVERESRIKILLASIPFLVGLAGLSIPRSFGHAKAWMLSGLLSALFLIGIGSMWTWSLSYPRERADEHFPVFDDCSTSAVLARLLPTGPDVEDLSHLEGGRRIPTGVFVQSAKFLGAYNVAVTGYVWQQDPTGEDFADEEDGVIFPEAEEYSIDLVSEGDGYRRWYFEANLRQPFDYATYPIDRERIWIRLWPRNFDQGAILVPDFHAYDLMSSELLPGLEEDFVLEGWTTCGSFFSYRAHSYGVDFGKRNYEAHNNLPELYFNIDLRRKFIGPFISDLMPMMVVAALLFAIVLIQSRRDESGLLGFSASTVLSYCSGLFFVLIISHVYVREKLAVPQIIYIEWFYFTMYVLLLLLSLNAILFARGRHLRLFDLEETEWVSLTYWPVTLGILFLVTLLTFY